MRTQLPGWEHTPTDRANLEPHPGMTWSWIIFRRRMTVVAVVWASLALLVAAGAAIIEGVSRL